MPQIDNAESLRQATFVRFWLTRVASVGGYQIFSVAIGWQMYNLTHSVFDLGLVGLAQFLPRILFALHAGVIVDRHNRRLLVAATQFVQAMSAALLAWGTLHGWLSREWIYVACLLVGTAKTIEMPALQALLPGLVSSTLLPRAVAASAAATQAATIIGPAFGGFLYALGAGWTYLLVFSLQMLACTLLLLLPNSRHKHPPAEPGLKSLLAGIHFVRSRPDLLGAISLDLFAVLLGGATALLPVYARDILHTDAWGLGLLRSAPAVGALLMSVWLARHPPTRHIGRTMFAAVAVFGIATIAFGLSSLFWLSLLSLVVLGGSDMISVVIRNSFVQLETPNEMRGRVGSLNSLFIGASNQLGEFESGLTAAWLGTVPSVALGGACTLLVVVLWMRWFPSLAQRDRMVTKDA